MNADVIVKALRHCYNEDIHGCEGCPINDIDLCYEANLELSAADLIESLQAQLAESQRRERAAVEDLETAESCITCEHDWDCEYSNSNGCSIANYKWRGPQEGEGNAETDNPD